MEKRFFELFEELKKLEPGVHIPGLENGLLVAFLEAAERHNLIVIVPKND